MVWKIVGWVVILTSVATPSHPCSVTRVQSAAELVEAAETIIVVRAEQLSSQRGRPSTMARSDTQVRFEVVEVLKGATPAAAFEINGSLTEQDDRNDGPVPYEFVRPGGRQGNCFALGYRQGAEYLLLLTRASQRAHGQAGDLTPYWAPLAPTNEQIFGAADPWVSWIRKAVAGLC